MSFCSLKFSSCQVVRTGASFFFNLDVTQRRSADANEGLKGAMSADCKLRTLPKRFRKKSEPAITVCAFEQFMPGYISGYDKNIYHLLSRAFRQSVSIAEIVDLDIFDIVSIRNVHITVDVACTRARYPR